MSIPIYIVPYTMQAGNYHHWSLFIHESANQQHVHEVVGEHPDFQYNHITIVKKHTDESKEDFVTGSSETTTKATTSKDYDNEHVEDILVGYIDVRDLQKVNDVILPNVYIDNENSGWCCQDWVLEALEELCLEVILDDEDEDYIAGVKRAKRRYFGPL